MTFTSRKKRPLQRDQCAYRDDRLFLVACDDTYAPEQYFSFFNLPRVKIVVSPTKDNYSHARYVLNRLMTYECEDDDERWMLLDTDHCINKTHLKEFKSALKDAQKKGVKVAISRSCFEVWLLLHHLDESAVMPLGDAAEVEQCLRKTLGEYNKKQLKAEHYPLEHVVVACRRAEQLDANTRRQLIPTSTTSRVYLLWKALAQKALRSQLPTAIWPLIHQQSAP